MAASLSSPSFPKYEQGKEISLVEMVARGPMVGDSVPFRPDERNETAALDGLDHRLAFAFSHQLQHLGVLRPDRDDHTATLGQLFDEAFGQFGSSGGDKDGVVGRVLRPAATAVSHLHPHIAET